MALNDTFSSSILKRGNKARESFSLKSIFFLIQNKRDGSFVLSEASENIEEKLDQVCRIIKRENLDLDGFLNFVQFLPYPQTYTLFCDPQFSYWQPHYYGEWQQLSPGYWTYNIN